jgi:hypothetical protein
MQIPKTPFEWLSWVLAIAALVAGVIMRADWVPLHVVRTCALVIGITTTINNFLWSGQLKYARETNDSTNKDSHKQNG